jgi:hypothetical protein
MSESNDYTPAAWAPSGGFTQAREAYNAHAGRDYQEARAANLTASKLLPDFIETQCSHPLIIDTDFTGSMIGWDGVMVGKFPYLDHEVRNEYLAKDTEISFGAYCDTRDHYPLQISGFANGAGMKKEMDKLVHASGGAGSGQQEEAHPLAMLYRARNTRMPNAVIKPPYILITDEMPCGMITVEQARELAKVKITRRLTRTEIIAEIMEKYSLYVILKPYDHEHISGDVLPSSTRRIYDCWQNILGEDRIAILPEAERVVDVIFGLLAKETNKIGYFRKEIEQRQKPEQVETVYKSLNTVHALPKPNSKPAGSSTGHSVTKGMGGGKQSKPLA